MTRSETGSVDTAVANARRTLGLDVHEPARTWSVARTQPGAPGFVLVLFGPAERASAIAAVDPLSGEVLETAHLGGPEGHRLITADEAIRRAGMAPDAQARLVWDPSRASRSRFYPLWELHSAQRTVWVDSVRGVVWDALDAPRGGGGSPAG